jgi:lipopolysaccharide/colanic/teichoic acid biosynthesis glycosyltransferase
MADVVPAVVSQQQSSSTVAGRVRVFDGEYVIHATLAIVILLFLIPVVVVIAMAVWMQDGGPVIFAHRRLGRDGKTFSCYKFRSMRVDAEARLAEVLAADPAARAEWARDHKLRNDPRVTPLGDVLRRSSLDELPQLFNVLKGEMSLVGPRPIVEEERVRYGRRFRYYCAVRPGLTGLWQVSGRNDVSYRTRVAMDACYAQRKCFALDLYILLITIPSVLRARGCY